MKPKIATIGVYGFQENDFFQALTSAGVDVFCDIRGRRGMRGARYAFANSTYLQKKLNELGIAYFHLKNLAPSQLTRELQKKEDEQIGIKKRERTNLGQSFIESYETETLGQFNPQGFLEMFPKNAEVIALFCVEKEPEACHRSLVASRLSETLELEVIHILP